MSFDVARRHMVDSQLRTNKVTNQNLLGAFETLPRERFVPADQTALAYIDEDLPVAPNRFLMEPSVQARLIQAACEEGGGVALVVACGTGYTAAVLAGLFDSVFALDGDPVVTAQASALMSELALDNVIVLEGPLADGWAKEGPYNAIIVDGGVEYVPDALTDQLADGGRLTTVVKSADGIGQGVLLYRHGGVVSRRVLFNASVPILPEFRKAAGFVF